VLNSVKHTYFINVHREKFALGMEFGEKCSGRCQRFG
jgi:hypothetical protein